MKVFHYPLTIIVGDMLDTNVELILKFFNINLLSLWGHVGYQR